MDQLSRFLLLILPFFSQHLARCRYLSPSELVTCVRGWGKLEEITAIEQRINNYTITINRENLGTPAQSYRHLSYLDLPLSPPSWQLFDKNHPIHMILLKTLCNKKSRQESNRKLWLDCLQFVNFKDYSSFNVKTDGHSHFRDLRHPLSLTVCARGERSLKVTANFSCCGPK